MCRMRRCITAATATLLLVSSSIAIAQGTSADSAEIRAVHEARVAAILRGDFDHLERLLSDDFVVTFGDGAVRGKSEYIADQSSGRIIMTAATHDQERFRVYGDAAVVTGRSALTLRMNDKEQPLVIRYTHVYIKQDDRWRMVAQHSSTIPNKR